MLCASVYLIAISVFPVMYNLTGEFERNDFIFNTILFLIGTGSLFGSIQFIKKSILFEQLLDLGFEKGIYARLEPILNDIVESQVSMNDVADQLRYMNTNIDRLQKRSHSTSTGAGLVDVREEVFRFLRLVLLINVSLAVFIYLLRAYGAILPYAMAMLFVLWWAEITYEFRMWKNSWVWVWVFVPILTIPITTMLADRLYGDEILVAAMSVVLVIYVATYYLWSRYLVERTLPFGISEVTKEDLPTSRLSGVRRIIDPIRGFVRRRARQISIVFFTASATLFLIVVLTIASMLGEFESPIPISIGHLSLIGLHVFIFFSVGRKLRRKSMAASRPAVLQKSS
uniref:Uncharacterized protein n=1 Tax=uncultured Methanosarcinales archaeon TaxID=183757 RepID=A0A7H1KNG7_9EURY|nr:hypothetical protein EKMJPAOO_00031 [uncultured Methanosarcinales archaeon]